MAPIGIVRIQIDRTAEFTLGGGPVAIIVEAHGGKRCVRFGERVVQIESFIYRRFGVRKRLRGREVRKPSERCPAVRETVVRQCIIRISLNGLLEVSNRLFEVLFGSPVPEKPTSGIG